MRGPGPVPVEAEPEPAAAADEAGGDVQQPVAQRLRFGFGQRRAGRAGGSSGSRRCRSTASMTAVSQAALMREGAGGEAAQAGVLAAADAVFDAGVGAVAGVEERQLPDARCRWRGTGSASRRGLRRRRVGRRGAGVPGGRGPACRPGSRPACRPGAGRSARPRARRRGAGRRRRWPAVQARAGSRLMAVAFPVGDRPADGELGRHALLAQAADVGEERLRAAGAVGADQDRDAVPVRVRDLRQRRRPGR